MATMAFGSLYPGSPNGQATVNPSRSAGPSARTVDMPNVPFVPGVAGYLGLSVPALVALAVLAWWLWEQYD